MKAFNNLVHSSVKVRPVGVSTMDIWEFQKLNVIAEKNGQTKSVSMKILYNLIYRKEKNDRVQHVAIAQKDANAYVSASIIGIKQLYNLIGALDIEATQEDTKFP